MAVVAEFHSISLDKLHESKLNPRKHFNAAALQELAASIKAHGVLTPLLVRPNAKGFEIAAGHRRYRAAQLADVAEVPAVVRAMTDAELLEILVVENDQREDVHPLEQAAGYKALMLLDGYDAKRIADRIGRSEKWVYDRVKLLQLTKEAQQLFLDGRITAGHAILLARLSPADQDRALKDGTFEQEDVRDLFGIDEEKRRKEDLYLGQKPVSVRELDGWIDTHVRFDAKKADPVLFPAVVEALAEAPKPLIPITSLYHVPDEARDGKGRTYGPTSWKRADGSKKGAKACEYSAPAVVVVGPGRGETFPVCLRSNIERCATHWGTERRELERRRKATASGKARPVQLSSWERQQAEQARRMAREEALRGRFNKAIPAILEAGAAAVKKASVRNLGAVLIAALRGGGKASELIPLTATPEGILRHAVWRLIVEDASSSWQAMVILPKRLGRFGVNAMAIMEKEQPEPKAEPPAAAAKPKKKAAKK